MIKEEFKFLEEEYYLDLYNTNAIKYKSYTKSWASILLSKILEMANLELTYKKDMPEEYIKDFIKVLLKKLYPHYNIIDIMENNGDMDIILKNPNRISADKELLGFCAELGLFDKSKDALEKVLAQYRKILSYEQENDHSGHDSETVLAYGFGSAALRSIINKIEP
jgi:hypothetical protein